MNILLRKSILNIFFFLTVTCVNIQSIYAKTLSYTEIKEITDSQKNVSQYSKFKITGTSWLSFRDVPYFIKKYVNIKEAKTLDYGCGAGRSTRFLQSLGLKTIGVDISEKFIKEASYLDKKNHYLLIKSGKIPVSDNSYDLIFSSHVFLMIPTKEKISVVLKEFHRVLKKDGISIIVTGSEEMHSPKKNWVSYETNFPENKKLTSGSVAKLLIKEVNAVFYDYNWTNEDYSQLFKENGFKILETHFPIGKKTDNYKWLSEKTASPYILYVIQKK